MTNPPLGLPAVRPAGSCRGLSRLGAVLGATLALFASPALAASPPVLSLVAGDGSYNAAVPGAASSSPLGDLEGMAVDASGNLYVVENATCRINRITPDGTLSRFAGNGTCGALTPGPALSSRLGYMTALAVDAAGNVFAADANHRQIDRVTPGGTLSIVAGTGTFGVVVAGTALASPMPNVYMLAPDPTGGVFFEDTNRHTIWKLAGGTLSQVAGNGSAGQAVAGPALSSPLGNGFGGAVVTSDGTLYTGDNWYRLVYKRAPDGTLSIVAGTGAYGTAIPGPATATPIGTPAGLGMDPAGNVYLADYGGCVIQQITPAGVLSIFAGTGSFGAPTAGPPLASPLDSPMFMAVDSSGIVYAASYTRIVRIGPPGPTAPRNLVIARDAGTAAISFDPPLNPGSSPITGYEVSSDGGATWSALTTAAGSGGARTATVSGLTQATTSLLVRAINAGSSGATAGGAAPAPVLPVVPALPEPTVLPAAPAPLEVTQTVVSTTPFVVAVRFRLPAACATGCTITRATLALRDGTVLGVRRDLEVPHAGYVRFTVPIDKAALLAAGAQILKPGWRTTQTRFTVVTRAGTGGAKWSRVKDGRIAVSLGRLESGRLPVFPGLL